MFIHLLVGEKDLLTSLATDNKVQQGYAWLRITRGTDGWDIVALKLYQWLCTAVLTAHENAAESVSSLGNWCTMEEGIGLLWQMEATHALITGTNPDEVAVTSIKMQFVKGAPNKLKPLVILAVTYATGNIGALTDALRDIGTMASEPAVRVLRENKSSKPKQQE